MNADVRALHDAEPIENPGKGHASGTTPTATTTLVTFAAGDFGQWRIDGVNAVIGASLEPAQRLAVIEGRDAQVAQGGRWMLRGSTSNTRYTGRAEATELSSKQEGLNRPTATRAALIPIQKTATWWALAQDERRAIFEEQSHHIALGLQYLPSIARRLHHCRELGEPFDFLTWFEYSPADSDAFERLVRDLRATPEWRFVDREVDIRLTRVA